MILIYADELIIKLVFTIVFTIAFDLNRNNTFIISDVIISLPVFLVLKLDMYMYNWFTVVRK